ncbi:MAG TPA: DUF503 domain-containing protein [Deltaproteobacteria bacterium]|nr:DUF503 domain-containing protein [Deltaproteobacteria bacterium]HPR53955.1 DUF503 domain-containing protein [Deltaproteobacteria bacterium]HXK46422.1 DUF503 domain-containing protein [Deltaproteobacteria bacterium]
MVVGACEVRLRVFGARSLKEKRKVLKSLKDRLLRLNLSVSEVADNDKWQAATIGMAMVSNDAAFLNSVIDKVILDIESEDEVEILAVKTEIIHV